MVINSKDIKAIFKLLLADTPNCRKRAQEIVVNYQNMFDNNDLTFHPTEEEDKIWDALEFIDLYGEKVNKTTYIYSLLDLIKYMKENNWS